MNKSDIVQAMATDASMTIEKAELFVDRVLDLIGMNLACGEVVSIRNFGKFEPRMRAAVTRKNPRSGVPVDTPEQVSVGFVASPALKQRINHR